MRSVQYTPEIDRVIYDRAAVDVVPEEDLPLLALALLDQADVELRDQREVREVLRRAGLRSEYSEAAAGDADQLALFAEAG